MSNYEADKTDPLWFLENPDDEESNLNSNTLSEQERTKNNVDEEIFSFNEVQNPSSKSDKQDEVLKPTDSLGYVKSEYPDGTITEITGKRPIKELDSLKSELESSLLALAKRSIENGKNPEFRITIGSNDNENQVENVKVEIGDNLLSDKVNSSTHEYQSGETIIPITIEQNEKSIGEMPINLQTLDTGVSDGTSTDGTFKTKIYFIGKSKGNNDSENNINKVENVTSKNDNQVCEEIGSTVIKFNDIISPKSHPLTGREEISTSLNLLGSDGETHKVELVVTIKDERKEPMKNTPTNTYINEINTDFPTMDSLLGSESLESKLERLSKRIDNLSKSTSSWTSGSWQSSKPSRVENREVRNDWSETETKDSYVRESDGARCYRTVTTSSQGRRVQTQCYKENRRAPRRANYGFYSGFDNLWNLDDDFNRMFSRFNRLLFF